MQRFLQQLLPSAKLDQSRQKSGGFTLIELLVVTVLVVLLMMTVSAMFMTFLVGNAQTNIRRQLKGEGNAMISQLEYIFRNAKTVTLSNGSNIATSCTGTSSINISDPSFVDITDLDGNTLRMVYNGTTKIVSINTQALNSTYVVVTAPTITCYGSTTSDKKSIKIDFQLQWEDNTSFVENFSTTVQIRNS